MVQLLRCFTTKKWITIKIVFIKDPNFLNFFSRPWFNEIRSFKIHDRNLLESLIEIFKVKMNHLVPETMNKVSDIVEWPYPLWNKLRFECSHCKIGNWKSYFCWLDDMEYILIEVKQCASINEFIVKNKKLWARKLPVLTL